MKRSILVEADGGPLAVILAGDEDPRIRVGPEASDGHDVQHRVQAAIAVSTEAMVNGLSAWLSRRGRDRHRARVAGEGVRRPEPARITDSDEHLVDDDAPRGGGPARDLAVPAVAIRVRGPDELVVVADPQRLRQVLENLLANAIRHSPEGGAVEVELAAERREVGAWAVLSVADQGPGIPPEVQPRLFQRFSTGPGSVGLGLGLYLAQRITAAHGGTLTADPSPRRGTRFVLSLPSENHELAAQA